MDCVDQEDNHTTHQNQSSMEENLAPIDVLPFQMNYHGPAPVKKFFRPHISSNDGNEWHAHFRGRKIVGKEVDLPDGMKLYHAKIGEKVSNLEGAVDLHHEYPRFRLWQHDHSPDTNSLQECFNWCEIANIVSNVDFLFSLIVKAMA